MSRYGCLAIIVALILLLFLLYGLGVLDSDLFKAIEKGNIEIVREIILKDSQKAKEYDGTLTPLHQAAYYSQIEIAKILIQHGADVNGKGGRHNFTPIFISAARNDIDFVKLLISSGAEVNIRDDLNRTPLLRAAKMNNLSSFKVLLDAGADVSAKDNNGKSVLDYAIKNRNTEMIDIIKGTLGTP